MDDDATTPIAIRQASARGLEIVWRDGHTSLFDVVFLRRACRCAACVDEWTGAAILQPGEVADDVRPVSIEPVGNYAIKIDFSDGHSSGIYTFEHLREIDSTAP